MKQVLQMEIQDYLEIILRRKWFIILPFILISLGGTIFSFQLPRVYRASTLILVQRQKVPEAYIQPTVTTPIGERLHTISQQIMSRTRLETIIDELNLYPDLRESLFLEEVVEKMREDIGLEVMGKGKGEDSFQLFYEGKEPRVVAAVANKLASLFIEENLKVREELAEGTTEFLDRELMRVKNQLEEQEDILRRFKEKYMGSLPEQLDANLRSLDRLQLQQQTIIVSLERARERKISLQGQISQISGMEPQEIIGEENGVDSEKPGLFESPQIHKLRQTLVSLQAKYTEKHPDVLRIKNEIKKCEEELASRIEGETPSDPSLSGSYGNITGTLMTQLKDADFEIKKLKKELEEVTARIADYQKRVEEIPKREQEILSLERDYANTQKNYQSLLEKKLNAQLAANMERMQKGERFKVLDPARIPQKPFKPNRPRIILVSLLLGLGLGAGLAFGVEFMNHSFLDIDDLEKFTDLPVLASIPRIVTDDDLKKQKTKKRIVFAFSFAVILIVIAALIVHFFFYPLNTLVAEYFGITITY